MEISDYARTKRRWLGPLVVVPLLTAGITAAVLVNKPPEFTATVQIQTPASDAGSDSRIGLYTANLNQALLVGAVLQDVSQRTGVPAGELATTTVTRIQKSDQLDLVLTSTAGPDQTLDAAKRLAQGGQLRLLGPAALNPEQGVRSASETLADAQADLYGYQQQIGYVPPLGSDAERPEPAALGGLPPDQREEMNIRQARVDAAAARLTDAQKSLVSLEDSVNSAREGTQIVSAVVGPEPAIRPVIEGAGIAGVLGAMVVLGIAILPDLFRRSSRRAASPETVNGPESQVPGGAGVAAPEPEIAGTAPASETPAPLVRPSPRPREMGGGDAVSATLPTTASQRQNDHAPPTYHLMQLQSPVSLRK